MSVSDVLAPVRAWWGEAKMWTLMYRSGVLAGISAAVVFVIWRVVAARRERTRLEALVASRTRQLRQGEELFRSIFEHASEGIFQSSLDGQNLRANPAMARICGYADPAQMQRELTDVASQFYVQADRRQEINAVVARDGAAVDWESEVRRRDGSTVWVRENVRTVIDPASEIAVYQGSIVDITARREMQTAQEQARLAAEAAHAAKSAFLTHVTHELRTPLTGILSNARVALRDRKLDDTNQARYALIVSSGEHLLRLIDEVLDLSRIEAGHMDLCPGPFLLGELVRTITDAFRSRAAEKRLEFICEVDASLPETVHGDPLRLRQVLDNLLGNAFKFTLRGRVTLNVRRAQPAGNVRFEVADTGVGIAADQLALIFEPFQQAAHAGNSERSGTGLGLHISARLASLMGGELRVESTLGQGSRFLFDLPLPDADHGETLHVREFNELQPVQPPSAAIHTPPASEIDALLTLSLQGDIVRLRARLKELAAADPGLADFARAVDALAAGFRMNAISEFLSRVRTQNGPDG